jgi:hypothetical protein
LSEGVDVGASVFLDMVADASGADERHPCWIDFVHRIEKRVDNLRIVVRAKRTQIKTHQKGWSQRNFTDALWKHYCDFKDKVVALTPPGLSLRDADRYLMGKDIYEAQEKKLTRIAGGEGKPRQKRKQHNANANETGADASVLMLENVGSSGDRPGAHA